MEIKIIKQELNIRISESITIYLAQLLTHLDNSTKKLKRTDEKWKTIEGILNLVSSTQQPFFLILPEIAVPASYVKNITDFIKNTFPPNTVTILGIELIQLTECKEIIDTLSITREETTDILKNNHKDRIVNPCLIIVKQDDKQCSYFLQFKITHSKFQGSLDEVENLLPSDYIYHFTAQHLNFLPLICSDFFNMPIGLYKKIIDKIDYEILKNGEPLDFIFNIQYNPSPDHQLFIHSLNRIYDDGYKCHRNLCTVFLNSILQGEKKGGLSKILFYKGHKLPEKQPVKQIDAPVVGYEFSENETLLCISFDRLAKSWDPNRDFSPLHFSSYEQHQGKWAMMENNEKYPIRYIVPMEKESSLSYQSYDELSHKLSDLGNFEKATEWAEKAQRYHEKRNDYLKAASTRLFIAIQYRHQGKIRLSLQNYASAESLIYHIERESPEFKLTLWRIKAGRTLVENYLIKGNCNNAYKKYALIIKDIKHYLSKSQIEFNIKKKIKLYKIHAERQQAEMKRLLGKYDIAYKSFTKAYSQYTYFCPEEKAYSALGQGDSLRMLGKFDDAMKKYREVEEFAREKKNNRLLARVIRNISEIYRITSNTDTLKKLLNELQYLSDETNYLFGKIFYLLISGGMFLKENLNLSEDNFGTSKNLSKLDGDYLAIEYAHSLFGIAEAKRLKSKHNEAKKYYEEAYGIYKETGILWGIIRTSIGACMIEPTHKLRKNLKR